MSALPDFVKTVNKPNYPYPFSVCTFVTRKDEYQEMLDSFIAAGFTTDICEYLVINNSETNGMDAYEGINTLLQKAAGEYIIVCHQDIILTETSTLQILNERMAGITLLDPTWAVLGNAGSVARLNKRHAFKIEYPGKAIEAKGTLPQKACSVDENFMLIKNSANLALSGNLSGYHLYGLDICLVADMLGYSCYVIDFLLIHKSRGNVDRSFYQALNELKLKYTRFMRGRYINTTIASFYLSGSKIKNRLFNTKLFRRVVKTGERLKAWLAPD
jgi:hypothetical protein